MVVVSGILRKKKNCNYFNRAKLVDMCMPLGEHALAPTSLQCYRSFKRSFNGIE